LRAKPVADPDQDSRPPADAARDRSSGQLDAPPPKFGMGFFDLGQSPVQFRQLVITFAIGHGAIERRAVGFTLKISHEPGYIRFACDVLAPRRWKFQTELCVMPPLSILLKKVRFGQKAAIKTRMFV
jgi:hypothetical protein